MSDADVIEVRFYQNDSQARGRITRDTFGRQKLVIVRDKTKLGSTAWSMRSPLPGEKWLCVVRHDTKPEDPRRGVLFVDLQQPVSMLASTACGGSLVVSGKRMKSLLVQPALLGLFDEIAEKLRLPQDDSRMSLQLDMGRPVGFRAIIGAPQVAYDECCTFAIRDGHDAPSRVLVRRPGVISSIVSLMAEPSQDPGPKTCYQLAELHIGKIMQPEPWSADNEHFLETSFGYWSKRAFWYDVTSMSDPFECTWQEVVEGRWRKDARLPAPTEGSEETEPVSDAVA